jgi:hypothetical protein
MKSKTTYWMAALLLAIWLPAPAFAQQGYRPKYDVVTIGGRFGGFSEAANLNDPGTADWRLGWMASVDATVWLHQYVGIRATAGWAQDSLRGTASLSGRRKFNKFFYDGDVVLRYPVRAGLGSVIPYVLGGAGAVTLHRLDTSTSEDFTKFAGNFGAGVEYRYKRIGARVEGRDLVYKFDRFAFDKTQHGIVWDGDVTVSF